MQGLPKAEYTLGYYFEEGIGCEADLGAAHCGTENLLKRIITVH